MKTLIRLIIVCIVLCGCRNMEYVEIEVHDTITVHKIDSIRQIVRERTIEYKIDSVSHTEYVKGDTVFIRDYRFIFRNVDKEVSDSTLKAITDSIRRKYSKTEYVEVEKELSLWQKTEIFLGNTLIWFLLILIVSIGFRKLFKH